MSSCVVRNVIRTTIEDVCIKISSGGTPSTSHSEYYEGDIPWLRTQEVDWSDVYDTSIKISEEALANSSAKMIPENCVIVAMYGATAAKSCINKIPLSTNQACCNLQVDPSKALYRYIYYWLCKNYLSLKALGEGTQSNLNAKKIRNFAIALPPLTEQDRIVAILDKYSSIKDQLLKQIDREIELTLKQYEYYRDEMLSFNASDVEFKALGDIAFYPKERTQIDVGGIYIGVEELLKNKAGANQTPLQGSSIKAIQFTEGDVLIGNIRPYLKKIWLSNTTGGTNGDVIVVRVNTSYDCLMNRQFLYFILSSDKFFSYANQYAKGAKMPRGDKAKILEYPIPIPSLEEQQRIVVILDKYSESVEKLVSNLRREKELVQQQYEYYREKLLTF